MTMSSGLPDEFRLRVVFDTNVYIAAALQPGLSEELLQRAVRGDFILYVSRLLLDELDRKLEEKFDFKKELRELYLARIEQIAQVVRPQAPVRVVKRDPADNRVLECGLEAKAHLIVTLDRDLLILKKWRSTAIVHPKTFSWIVPKE